MEKIAVIFGGQSSEHDVSTTSGLFVSKSIDKEKYSVSNIYIDKDGTWYKYNGDKYTIDLGEQLENLEPLEDIMGYLKGFDCIFPVLHGKYGEDGTIQGLFELIEVPYVGCKVLASSVAMDKVYTKIVLEKAGINQVKSRYVKALKDKYVYVDSDFSEEDIALEDLADRLEKELGFPMFIKPSNSGSSIGISKCENKQELMDGIVEAAKFDFKILIEEGLDIRELECAVLGNEDVFVSNIGEIVSAEGFYDYDSKYKNNTSEIIEEASLDPEIESKIKAMAKKAFKAIDGKGLSRIDFFLDKEGNVYLNEINTLPGFTNISMYPKLMLKSGIDPKELTTKLIELAQE